MLDISKEILKAGLKIALVAASVVSVSAQVGQGGPVSKENTSAESLIIGKEVVVKVVAVRESLGIPDRFMWPSDGMKFVSVEIIIENRGKSDWDLTPSGFTLKDAEGGVYNYYGLAPPEVAEPKLKSGSVDGGDFVKGWVTFEVVTTVNVKSLKLRYEYPTLAEPRDKSGWIPLSAVIK